MTFTLKAIGERAIFELREATRLNMNSLVIIDDPIINRLRNHGIKIPYFFELKDHYIGIDKNGFVNIVETSKFKDVCTIFLNMIYR